MKNENDPIAKALGILPMITVTPKQEVAVSEPQNPIEEDFGKARTNYHNLIDSGQSALSELLIVAKQSQNPRAYEVLFNAMKMLGEMNSSMLDLHSKNKELHPETDLSNNAKSITNNNLFLGTTAEMQQLLIDIKNGKTIEGSLND